MIEFAITREENKMLLTKEEWLAPLRKTVSERAEALIEIAHPDFRPALRRQAVEEGLIW